MGLGDEKEGERKGRERRWKMGEEGHIRKKGMDEEQKEKIIEGWKINLYQKHRVPFPPPMHSIVNK